MRIDLRFTLGIAIGLLSLLLCAQSASAETWSGQSGGSDNNRFRSSKPASRLGISWGSENTIQSSEAFCISYQDGLVLSTVKDPGTGEERTIAVNADTGVEVWSAGGYDEARGCPLVDNGVAYTAFKRSSDQLWTVSARELTGGDLLWQNPFTAGTSFPSNNFSFSTTGLAVSGDRVFVITQTGSPYSLRALDRTNGDELWSKTGSDQIMGAAEGTVVATTTGGVEGFAAEDGASKWVAAGNVQDAVLHDGSFFSSLGYDEITARNLESGQVSWQKDCGNGYSFGLFKSVADDDHLYMPCLRDYDVAEYPIKLMAVDLDDGHEVWAINLHSVGQRVFRLGNRIFVEGNVYEDRSVTEENWSMIDPNTGQVVHESTGNFPNPENLGGTTYGEGHFFQWVSESGNPGEGPFSLVARGDTIAPELTLAGPPVAAYKTASQTIAWAADDGFESPLDHFEIAVNGQSLDPNVPGNETSRQISLAPGPNEVEVKAVDGGGNPTIDSRQITIVPSPVPVADLLAPPDPVLSGSQVTLDASASRDAVLDGQITRFQWDLDGNGSFETDGGSSPTIQTTPTELGSRNVAVKVTNDSGNTATASGRIDVRRVPPPGAGIAGVSINEAATFTNDPNVKLTVVWPALASDLAVSNDGGFATSEVFPLPANGLTPWTLDESGPERLPKTVYLRYYGAGSDLNTYTDDIILDQTAPVIQQATLVGTGASTSGTNRTIGPAATTSATKRKRTKPQRIRLRAKDTTSGVVAIQAARSKKKKGPVIKVGKRVTNLRKVINPKVKYRPKLIRVKDAAGNWSRFQKVR